MGGNAVVRPTSSAACLRVGTRSEHDAVEADLDLRRLRHPAELAALLHGWTGVWHEVQLAAAAPGAAAEATAELLPPATQSLRWLERDLADIGGASAGVLAHETSARTDAAGGSRLRRFLAETSTTWGVAYVLRGSRLGGSVLAPLVRAQLGLTSASGTCFLASNGTDPGREWVSFRRRLDAADLVATDLAAAVDAARWTFRWVGTVITSTAAPLPLLAGQAST
jgi:heme oxygenase